MLSTQMFLYLQLLEFVPLVELLLSKATALVQAGHAYRCISII
jgi:hypothetical protein